MIINNKFGQCGLNHTRYVLKLTFLKNNVKSFVTTDDRLCFITTDNHLYFCGRRSDDFSVKHQNLLIAMFIA